jgi:hypothetical protein
MDRVMIATEPVSAAIPSGTERQSRMATGGQPEPGVAPPVQRKDESFPSLQNALADILPPLPAPPDPPGTAYVAAVLSGALSPKPTTAREIFLRVGEWTPPDSPLHLADKTI